MSLDGISKGSLRFDEFPTNMKRRTPFGGRATRLLAYENARPSESRRRPLRSRHARTPPSAFPFLHITMSKSRSNARPRATCPNPRWKQIPHLESTTAGNRPRRAQVLIRFCPRIARSRIVPQEVGTTRAKPSFRQWPMPCQGAGNRDGRPRIFPGACDLEATILPECAPTLAFR